MSYCIDVRERGTDGQTMLYASLSKVLVYRKNDSGEMILGHKIYPCLTPTGKGREGVEKKKGNGTAWLHQSAVSLSKYIYLSLPSWKFYYYDHEVLACSRSRVL